MPPDSLTLTTNHAMLLLPQMVLFAVGTLLLVISRFARRATSSTAVWAKPSALGALLLAGGLMALGVSPGEPGPLARDGLATLAVGGAWCWGILLVIAWPRDPDAGRSFQTAGLLLLVVAGMMLTGVVVDLALLAVAIELVFVPLGGLLFVLPGSHRHEAALKHLMLGALATVLWLLGLSFLFGLAGATSLPQISTTLAAGSLEFSAWQNLAGLALLLMMAGLGFRLFAAPFHFHALDIFQGTTNHGRGCLGGGQLLDSAGGPGACDWDQFARSRRYRLAAGLYHGRAEHVARLRDGRLARSSAAFAGCCGGGSGGAAAGRCSCRVCSRWQ